MYYMCLGSVMATFFNDILYFIPRPPNKGSCQLRLSSGQDSTCFTMSNSPIPRTMSLIMHKTPMTMRSPHPGCRFERKPIIKQTTSYSLINHPVGTFESLIIIRPEVLLPRLSSSPTSRTHLRSLSILHCSEIHISSLFSLYP